MIIQIIDSFISALAVCVITGLIVVLLVAIFGMFNTKINCNNHYLKKELKDRNKIIANLLNSRR